MRSVFFLLSLACFCASSSAAEGVADDPNDLRPSIEDLKPVPENQIRLPILPPGPTPTPPPQPVVPDVKPVDPPAPQEVTDLKSDQFFVIEADVPFFVLDSRVGLVSIAYDQGPIRLRGKFADGTGTVETRTYQSKYLATVEAVTKGQVELLVVPAGATDAGVVIRRTLTVMGQAPQPPPGPGPGPTPDPDDPPTPGPIDSFRVIFVKESGATLPPQQTAIPAAKAIRDYLTARTTAEGGLAGWREYDPEQITVNEQPAMKALWEAVKPKLLPAPCLVIEVNGRRIVMPFPTTVEGALAKLKEYGGA
jgi:hypothetical protein